MKRLNFLFVELLLASTMMFACDSVKTGNPDEQIELALKYIKEDSTNVDKGIGLLTDLANDGNANAQYLLGKVFTTGDYVEPNFKKR